MRALIVAVILALTSLPAVAFDDPRALVEAIYAPYQTPGAAADQDPAQYYSERLKGLISGHAAKAAGQLLDAQISAEDSGPVAPALSFNPFIDAQHSLLMDLSIGQPVVQKTKALVTVSFTNFDTATLLSLSLVRDPDGWKVDDVASLGDGENWLLSWLLQYDPFQIN
ncbi:MAG: DUF3828 domain-containing protein [Devosia nanyangense]|uniref:DUF3828 domain-containing protein n=1 Tax=Devosia nanyangense TaxID=1228055 RepID=A0A933L687_9HYPH|nr:DUF3828 domain-containing protein [Devosia nanyangense]